MHATPVLFSVSSSFWKNFIAGTAAIGVLLFSTGCNNSSHGSMAQSPPPQSISEPVRPVDTEHSPAEAPAIPSADNSDTYNANNTARPVAPAEIARPLAEIVPTPTDAYAAQKPGDSKELPVFVTPPSASVQAPAPRSISVTVTKPAAPVVAAVSVRYHTLGKGETLYGVARNYHVNLKQIISANNFKDPNHLAVGTKVCIPN